MGICRASKTTIGPFVFCAGKRQVRPTEAPFRLVDFLPELGKDDSVIDIGAGTGIIPLLIAARSEVRSIVACEVSVEAARVAQENISSNSLEKRICLRVCDYRDLPGLYPEGSFSVVISNPPFMKKGSARVSPYGERALSRYELKGSMDELLRVSAHLAGKAGRLFYIYPVQRLGEMMAGLQGVGFAATRLGFIHASPRKDAGLFMVEAARGNGLKVEPLLGVG